MKRYAQILNNKAHWIFEADKKPKFAPDIVLIDITGSSEVQEGWDYDAETGAFTETNPIFPEPTETELLQDYVMDVDFRLAMMELGF